MSPSPTRQLGKLSLGENMPTTRSQTHRSRQHRHPQQSPAPAPATATARNASASRRRHSLRASQRQEGGGRPGRHRRGNNDNRKIYQEERAESGIEIEAESQDEENFNDNRGQGETSPDNMASMILAEKSRIVYDIESLDLESRVRALAGLSGRFDVVYCRESSSVYEFQLIERPRIQIRNEGADCTCSEYGNRPDIACRHIFVSLVCLERVDRATDNILVARRPGIRQHLASYSPSAFTAI